MTYLDEAGKSRLADEARVRADERTKLGRLKPILGAKLINHGNPDERFTLNEVEDAFDAALVEADPSMGKTVTVELDRDEAEALLRTEEFNDQDQNARFAEATALNKIRAALASHPTPDGEQSELERYRTVFGDLCWNCGGSGEIPGALDDQDSGGLVVCPDCKGKGTK